MGFPYRIWSERGSTGALWRFVFTSTETENAMGPQNQDENFFGNQCRVVEEQLAIARELLNKEIIDPPELSIPELRRVVRLGEALIKSCKNERNEWAPHKAYLRQGERTNAFEEAMKEIIWCISVALFSDNHNEECLPGNRSLPLKEFPQAVLGSKEKYLLRKAALADEEMIQKKLDIWLAEHKCSAEDCGSSGAEGEGPLCLAAQIKSRKASNDAGSTSRGWKGNDINILWVTDNEVLKKGKSIESGGFGTVSETKWLGDTYAMKELQMSEYDEGFLRNFAAETNAMAKLNHPHIVKVVAACSFEEGREVPYFLLMERMPNNLRKYMEIRMRKFNGPPFSIRAGIDLMLQVAEAMNYMNDQDMVHRDLKPENILVEEAVSEKDDAELFKEGFVIAKLADFGLAKVKREVTDRLTENKGTRRYMAPEVFGVHKHSSRNFLGRKPDIYSFGIICYEILTGKKAFEDVKLGDLYELISRPGNPVRPKLPESCPKVLASLICECWHTEPERRPTFEEISESLRYLKGLLMMPGGKEHLYLAGYWRRLGTPFRTHKVEAQGPFLLGSEYLYTCDGSSTGLRAINVFFSEENLTGFEVEYDLNGQMFVGRVHGFSMTSPPGQVKFQYPSEYLIQVKGSCAPPARYGLGYTWTSPKCLSLTSLTFITNKATYGPFGVPRGQAFSSEPARIVGFFSVGGSWLYYGTSKIPPFPVGRCIESIGILTIPDGNTM